MTEIRKSLTERQNIGDPRDPPLVPSFRAEILFAGEQSNARNPIYIDFHGGPESGEKCLLLRKTAFPAQFAVEVIFKMVDGAAGIFDFPIFPEISDFPD